MEELKLEYRVPADEDGFMEYECPFCERIFRLNDNLFNKNTEIYCPYCGLKESSNKFFTTESVEYQKKIAQEKQKTILQVNLIK